MTRWMAGAAAAGALALAFFVGRPLLLAEEHEEGGHERGGQGHGEPAGEAGGTEPGTYAEAMAAIAVHQAAVGAHIDRRELADLHKAAEPIRDIAKTLAALALKEASGIPPEQVREVNLLSKDLAATWDKIDAAGDAGDLEASKAVYAEMSALIAKLQEVGKGGAAASEAWYCSMGCEKGKTYPAPGKCPVCGMDLGKVEAAHAEAGPHGGIVKPIGENRAELVVGSEGAFSVQFAGPDGKAPFRVGMSAVRAEVQAVGEEAVAEVPLRAPAGEGEAKYYTRFDGVVPEPLRGKPLRLTLTLTEGEKPVQATFEVPAKEGVKAPPHEPEPGQGGHPDHGGHEHTH